MLVLFWLLLFLTAICLILLMPALWGKRIYNTYRNARVVNCPETRSPVAVRFQAWRAAVSGLSGRPRLRLADCTRWPDRAGCDQACIPDAERAADPPALRVATTHGIAHLPTLVAAAAAWVLGMAWHSEYLFRSLWAHAVGLTDQQAHDLARQWAPHLATAGACLLFSYGVAALLAQVGVRSFRHGVQMSVSAWLIIAAFLLASGGSTLNTAFLWVEGGYTFLAAVLVGAIAGGVPRRILIKDSGEKNSSPSVLAA